jgi:hypothetical protein
VADGWRVGMGRVVRAVMSASSRVAAAGAAGVRECAGRMPERWAHDTKRPTRIRMERFVSCG